MGFFRRLGLNLATTIFSTFLVIFAVSLSAYVVLDKPATVKNALTDSGAYTVLVNNTLSQKQGELSAYLPVDQPEVQKAVEDAFSTSYLQRTTEHNIDATYAWIHGDTAKPRYSADLSEPKQALANNISQLVNQKLAGLPACTKLVVPTTLDDILNLTCRPVGFSTEYLTSAAQSAVEQSSLFDQVVAPVLTLQDKQGKSLTDSLSILPTVYHYFVISLFVMPVILVLSGLAVIFGGETKRQGVKRIARSLIVTGILTVLLSFLAVWLLGKAAGLAAGSSSDLILVEGKIVEIAHIIGRQLRNWLAGIGGGYAGLGIVMLVGMYLLGKKTARQNMDLNKSLGYNNNIPSAGTMFDPAVEGSAGKVEKRPLGVGHQPEADAAPSAQPDDHEQPTKNGPQGSGRIQL
jgi:hypothetical protein